MAEVQQNFQHSGNSLLSTSMAVLDYNKKRLFGLNANCHVICNITIFSHRLISNSRRETLLRHQNPLGAGWSVGVELVNLAARVTHVQECVAEGYRQAKVWVPIWVLDAIWVSKLCEKY